MYTCIYLHIYSNILVYGFVQCHTDVLICVEQPYSNLLTAPDLCSKKCALNSQLGELEPNPPEPPKQLSSSDFLLARGCAEAGDCNAIMGATHFFGGVPVVLTGYEMPPRRAFSYIYPATSNPKDHGNSYMLLTLSFSYPRLGYPS